MYVFFEQTVLASMLHSLMFHLLINCFCHILTLGSGVLWCRLSCISSWQPGTCFLKFLGIVCYLSKFVNFSCATLLNTQCELQSVVSYHFVIIVLHYSRLTNVICAASLCQVVFTMEKMTVEHTPVCLLGELLIKIERQISFYSSACAE